MTQKDLLDAAEQVTTLRKALREAIEDRNILSEDTMRLSKMCNDLRVENTRLLGSLKTALDERDESDVSFNSADRCIDSITLIANGDENDAVKIKTSIISLILAYDKSQQAIH